VWSINEEDGKVLWKFSTGVSNYMVSCDESGIYFGTFSGEFYSLSKEGKIIWSKKLSSARIVSYPAIYDNKIAIGSEDGKFFVIDKRDGKTIFEFQTYGPIREGAVFDYEGNIYIASYDQKVYSFTPDGKLRWSVKTEGGMYSACSLWYYKNNLVCTIGSKDGNIYTINTKDGEILWKIAVGPVSIGAIVGNFIWVATDDNRLVSLTQFGKIYLIKEFEEIYYSSPTIFDGRIVVGNDEDKIFSIPYSEKLLDSPWPVYRGNLQRTGKIKVK
jgi:outer membrane protein assembly factor BamB